MQILAPGTIAANSSDFTVDTPATVFLKQLDGTSAAPGPHVLVQIKSADGEYRTVGTLTADDHAKVIAGPGTYRVARLPNRAGCGVDVEGAA